MDFWILSAIIIVPVIGALVVLLVPRDMERLAKWAALGFSLVVFCMAAWVFFNYQTCTRDAAGYCFVEDHQWFDVIGARWRAGVDGLSAPLILLSGIITPLAVLISFEIHDRVKMHMALLLLMEAGMIGVFIALDLVIFFIFWEVGLVPMYFLINQWGGEDRRWASIKFLLYTMAGSLGLLLAIQVVGLSALSLGAGADAFSISYLHEAWPQFTTPEGTLFGAPVDLVKNVAFVAFFIAFAIKIPIWPFHTWLPDAHTEAPTAGSMVLAGVLLKLGAYGMLRLVAPLFPQQAAAAAPFIAVLGMLSIVLGAWSSYGQTDFKKLIAYSSVNHMGFVVMGIATAMYFVGGGGAELDIDAAQQLQNAIHATNGAVLQMFTHGISSAAMFLLVGALYHKAHTRQLTDFGGLWLAAPMYGGVLLFTSMGSLGLPGLSGFVSEWMVVSGSFTFFPLVMGLSMVGLLFTGLYILKGIQKVLHGPLNTRWQGAKLEIEWRELAALAPLMALMLLIGLSPGWLVNVINQFSSGFFG
ncbi:MAG: NADH-quinone oxidoreductase subunit M [Anaerolineae bacterium]|nr:NADH-quinone oxidoreductase subunit M [Anaerolineae bacterium]